LAQLEQLPSFVERKKQHYLQYKERIAGIPGLSLLDAPPYCESNYWFYSVLIDPPRYRMARDELLKKFGARNIQARPVWKLNHTQKPYSRNQAFEIQKASYFVERIVNIPCSVGLTDEEIERVVDVLRNQR